MRVAVVAVMLSSLLVASGCTGGTASSEPVMTQVPSDGRTSSPAATAMSGDPATGSTTLTAMADGPVFETVTGLAAGADLAIRGLVEDDGSRQVDDGGNAGGGGLPLVIHAVSVREVLVGDTSADRIQVAVLDDEAFVGAQAVRLRPGDEVLLYLRRETRSSAPGVDVHGGFYTPLNLGNGVLRVDGGQAIPTGPLPNRLDEDSTPPPPPSVSPEGEEAPPADGDAMLLDDVVVATRAAG